MTVANKLSLHPAAYLQPRNVYCKVVLVMLCQYMSVILSEFIFDKFVIMSTSLLNNSVVIVLSISI